MINYFVRHPVAANLLMVIICILGVFVINKIERETFPEFAASTVGVTVAYPGASARDVDEDICVPLENALTGITGLTEQTCLSMDGRASVTAELEEGGDIIQFFNDVFSGVSGVNDLPADEETPLVEIKARTDMVALVAVSGITGKQGLGEYSDQLADRLLALDGVAETAVSGITDRELQVVFDQAALHRFGLSSSSIIDAIQSRSLAQPLGTADLADKSVVLRYADTRRTVSELQDLIVLENADGGFVRLRDLAAVQIRDTDENVEAFINGAQAAIISVSKSKTADSIRVFEQVSAVLEAERAAYPAPFSLDVTSNMTEVVQERLQLILGNIAIGLVLVFGTMWLFFSLRDALWISAALPVSFLGTLFMMSVLGITVNIITLVALLMAVGLIMDDSIVIAENIDKWRHRVGPVEAAARGTAEVMPGVVSSFLTTASVFGPLMFLTGQMGQVLKYIPFVLLITLSLSLIEGFLILPHHLSHAGKGTPKDGEERLAARLLDRFKEGVVLPIATRLVAVRYLTVGSVIAVLILSIGLMASGTVKLIGFPATEGDTITARFSLTSGIARERTVATVDQLLAGLYTVDADLSPKTVDQAPLVERALVQYAVNSDVYDNGSNTATITVDLLESSKRNVSATAVLKAWRDAAGPIPDLIQSSFTQSEMGPGGFDLDVELTSYDLEELEAASNAMLAALVARPDVVEASQDFYGGRQEVQLALNEYGYSVGLSPQGLASQIRSAFEGAETDSFRSAQSNTAVRVKLDDAVANLTQLEQFPVTVGAGKQVALALVADISVATGYPTITRKNGRALARIRGQIDTATITSAQISAVVSDEIAPTLATQFPGVAVAISGATQEQNESQSSMGSLLMLGLVGVYMVLAFQFRSYTLPVVVMLSIPFALIGTIMGHWALGIDMSMPSLIGFASLAGIVVNNAILFLTFFQSHLVGNDYIAASLNAVRARFRPIMLSTSTTVAGLVPLILDTSPQVQTMVPMVVSVAFGLLASMLLVLLVFPSMMSIYFDVFSVRKWVGQFAKD
ncbi:efflux RND transporter permease subunit [Pelagimonas varians]|uniref:Efflux pump membrane transporter BepE n=1 Tax=Pelagimonas varians TaxID=696760 RepID=A0A238KNP9_9RHOB|nr:efflux RND transporter permease subunit [Pelagimonas varians]PYG28857.1 multidrug efflux pump subunit AcrB [Pelagimonas varians]SMX44358.1 Efflux pump membrane transporter BepE [Pelagimonas varians]